MMERFGAVRRSFGAVLRRSMLGVSVLALALTGCAGSKPKPAPDEGASAWHLSDKIGPDSLVALADSAIRAAEPDFARRALLRAADLDPQNPRVRVGLGRYYTAILRYKDAKTEFDRAAALEPESPEPPYWLGVAYLKAGEKDDALAALNRALRLDPTHAGAREAIRPLLEERYKGAGVPPDYATIPEHTTISRGELGVMLAVEMGLDPDHITWRTDATHRTDWPGLDEAWGSRWVRAAVASGWIAPLADRDLHLEDPVTRGALAITITEVATMSATHAKADSAGASAPAITARSATATVFPDLGPHHYLGHVAAEAARFGLPLRDGGRFEPQSFATGLEALRAVQGLAHWMGAHPAVSGGPDGSSLVK